MNSSSIAPLRGSVSYFSERFRAASLRSHLASASSTVANRLISLSRVRLMCGAGFSFLFRLTIIANPKFSGSKCSGRKLTCSKILRKLPGAPALALKLPVMSPGGLGAKVESRRTFVG